MTSDTDFSSDAQVQPDRADLQLTFFGLAVQYSQTLARSIPRYAPCSVPIRVMAFPVLVRASYHAGRGESRTGATSSPAYQRR
jgi:hypothetical protein